MLGQVVAVRTNYLFHISYSFTHLRRRWYADKLYSSAYQQLKLRSNQLSKD
jgi:hypothetical protein